MAETLVEIGSTGHAENFNRLLFHPAFNETIDELNSLNIQIPPGNNANLDFNLYAYPSGGKLLSNIEEIKSYKLNPKNGEKLEKNITISAYDESLNSFSALEGIAYLTSHSLVVLSKTDYIPANLLTFYFYTRSKSYTESTKAIRYSEDPTADSNIDYVKDRTKFILNTAPLNSLLLIDGPLVGGQVTGYTNKLNEGLLKKNIIPIFFIKNSNSNLVTDHIKELKGKYNSDMHYAYSSLKQGERTGFFRYEDQQNPNNAKMFCYLKAFDASPLRVEFHRNTFKQYEDKIADIMDLVYYLLLVQGDLKNPQVRPIAIAEKYARATLKLTSIHKLMKDSGITATMNQERFGW